MECERKEEKAGQIEGLGTRCEEGQWAPQHDSLMDEAAMRSDLRYASSMRTVAICLVLVFFHCFGSEEHYRFGPAPDFVVLGVVIDTWFKYWVLVALVLFVGATTMISKQRGKPIIKFNVNNPDKSHIVGISRDELIFHTVWLGAMELLMDGLAVLVFVAKFDIIISGVIASIALTVWNTHALLSKKTFSVSTWRYR